MHDILLDKAQGGCYIASTVSGASRTLRGGNAYPNNRLIFVDRALFGDLTEKPEFLTLTKEFRAEGVATESNKIQASGAYRQHAAPLNGIHSDPKERPAMLRMKMEDATRYLPHDPTGIEYRWYVVDDARADSLTGQPSLVMVGSKAECERYMQRHA